MADHYTNYYLLQSGGGLTNIGAVYQQSQFIQHGRGLGSFFGGLVRYLKPIFMHGLNAVKKEAMHTGAQILGEIGTRPFHEIIKDSTKTAVKNLQDKAINHIRNNMQGSGINGGINKFKKYNCGSLTDVNSYKPLLLKSKKKEIKTPKNKVAKKKNSKKKNLKQKKSKVHYKGL